VKKKDGNIMKKQVIRVAGLLIAMMLTGCIPEQKMVWSPDGKQAMLLSDGKLYRCDSDGTLSAELLDGVSKVAWLGDSSHLVVAREVEFTDWSQVEGLLEPAEREKLIALTDGVYRDYAKNGDFEQALKNVVEPARLSDAQGGMVGLYAKQHYPDLFAAANLEEKNPLSVGVFMIETAEMKDGAFLAGARIATVTATVQDLRISPDDRNVAFIRGDDNSVVDLYVVSLDGASAARRVAQNVALFPDWSRDGRFLVYAVLGVAPGDELALGSVNRRQIADENGLLEEFSDPEELVGVITHPFIRIRCLPDDSIVFTAMEVHLPAVAGDMPEYMNFFRFDPRRPATVERMFPRKIESSFGDASELFELSPDGQHIAFVDAETRTAVLTVATGELKRMPDSADDAANMLPSWRGNSELTFVCSLGDENGPKHGAVVRCSLDGDPVVVEMSASWPDEVLESVMK
jgi:hypothetical protein